MTDLDQKLVNDKIHKTMSSRHNIYKFIKMHLIINKKLTVSDIRMKLSGHCKHCNKKGCKNIRWRFNGAAYFDSRMNCNHVCQECFESEAEYWSEMWDSYYSSLI